MRALQSPTLQPQTPLLFPPPKTNALSQSSLHPVQHSTSSSHISSLHKPNETPSTSTVTIPTTTTGPTASSSDKVKMTTPSSATKVSEPMEAVTDIQNESQSDRETQENVQQPTVTTSTASESIDELQSNDLLNDLVADTGYPTPPPVLDDTSIQSEAMTEPLISEVLPDQEPSSVADQSTATDQPLLPLDQPLDELLDQSLLPSDQPLLPLDQSGLVPSSDQPLVSSDQSLLPLDQSGLVPSSDQPLEPPDVPTINNQPMTFPEEADQVSTPPASDNKDMPLDQHEEPESFKEPTEESMELETQSEKDIHNEAISEQEKTLEQ